MATKRIYVRPENIDKLDKEELKRQNIHVCLVIDPEEHFFKMEQNKIIKEAIEIVMKLKDGGFIDTDYVGGFSEWTIRAAALAFAFNYGYDGYDYEIEFYNKYIINIKKENTSVNYFRDRIESVRRVFEYYNYNYDNDDLWTLTACLWQNENIGEYVLSIYERDCLDDPYYKEIGYVLKTILKKEDIE